MIGWLEDCFATQNHLGISNRFVEVMPRGSFIYWIFWDFNRISLPSGQNSTHESQKNHFFTSNFSNRLLSNTQATDLSSNLRQAFAAKGQTITVSMAGPKPVNRQQVGFGWSTFVFFWPQWPYLKISGKSYETIGNPEIFSKWSEVQAGNMLSWCCDSLRIRMEEYGQSALIPPYPFWGQQGLNILQPYSHGTASFLAHFAPLPPHLVCELFGWSIDSVTDMKHQCFSIIRASNFFSAFVRPVRESQVLTSTKFEREDGFAPENMLCYLVTSGVGVACHPKVLQGDIEWDNGKSFAHQHFTKCLKDLKR